MEEFRAHEFYQEDSSEGGASISFGRMASMASMISSDSGDRELTDMQKRRATRVALDQSLEREEGEVPFINRRSTTLFFAAMILINGVLIGVEADVHIDDDFSWQSTDDLVWLGVESFFLFVFTTELTARVRTDGFFATFRDYWNVFDFLLIVIGIVDTALFALFEINANFTFMRLLRLCRLARIVRMVRFFKALFVLLQGMLNAMRLIIWMVILLLTLIYLCAIVARQTVSYGQHSGKHFSTMGRSCCPSSS